MKKLMIAVAIVCAAAFAQASSIKWSSAGLSAAAQLFGPDGTTLISTWAGQTGYSITSAILMNEADYSQSAFLAGLRDGTVTWGDSQLDAAPIASSKIAAHTSSELSGLAGTSVNVYYAILATDAAGNENVLLSTSLAADVPAGEGVSVTVGWGTAGGTFSANVKGDAAYEGAGWYAVPEPTSGLLMLLGMCGLALRRRRA